MKSFKRVWLLFIASLLGSCTSYYPVPVYTPQTKTTGDTVTIAEPTANDNGKDANIKPRTLVAIGDVLLAAKTYKVYADAYLAKSEDIKIEISNYSELGFLGGVGTLIAGLTGSPDGAAAGALVSTSSSIPAERYSLLVQSANYEKASDTMHCMYRAIAVENKKENLPVVDFLNDMAYQVHRQLRKAQNSVSLVDVDLAKVKQAVEKEKKTAAEAANALSKRQSLVALDESESVLLRKDYEAKLELCLSQF